jgi:hypothetical protein
MADDVDLGTCPRCGEVANMLEDHSCDVEPVFDGVCPMCGEPYERYLTHLQRCDINQ